MFDEVCADGFAEVTDVKRGLGEPGNDNQNTYSKHIFKYGIYKAN